MKTTASKRAKTMPVTFDEFKQSCNARGYVDGVIDQTTFTQPQNIFAMRTKNKIKAEIKPTVFTVGFGRTTEELEILQTEVVARGYEIDKVTTTFFSISINKDVDVISQFWTIVEILEDVDTIVGRQIGLARKVFTREEADQNIFEKIAKRYRHAIDEKDQYLLDAARDLLSGDKIDHLITVGQSKNGSATSYREHIVPCIMIHNQAIDMLLAGSSISEVAQMIKANLSIVRISDDEQELIDVKLGLRTVMPAGWKFGDDPFARLVAGNIELV